MVPTITGDCAKTDYNTWVRYECNDTILRAMEYSNNQCNGQGTPREGAVFINGTCEQHGYNYDEIVYCDNNYITIPNTTISITTVPNTTISNKTIPNTTISSGAYNKNKHSIFITFVFIFIHIFSHIIIN